MSSDTRGLVAPAGRIACNAMSEKIELGGWWRTQSRETGLRTPNSLLTGKRTGNFSIFGRSLENHP
jgi:hypothetical protein